jgi:hypothetical protein
MKVSVRYFDKPKMKWKSEYVKITIRARRKRNTI